MKEKKLASKLKVKVSQVEGKNIGFLYHFTSMPSFKSILVNDILRKGYSAYQNSLLGIHDPVVSFTRNKNLSSQYTTARGMDVRLVVDGNRLSDNYKIEPIKNRGSISSEAEEIVMSDISNFSRYLVAIDVLNVDNFEVYLIADYEFSGKVNNLKGRGVKINYV